MSETWLERIERASDHEEAWRKKAEEVVKRYRDERKRNSSQFNILWANTETQRPQLLSSTPKPDVRRRYRDEDIIGRKVAEVLERALEFSADAYDFDRLGQKLVTDFLLPGRAVARVRYVPVIGYGDPVRVRVQEELNEFGEVVRYSHDGESVDEVERDEHGPYIKGDPEEEVVYEEVRCEYVDWDMFRMDPAKEWSRVSWVAFGSDMSRAELVAAFGDKGKDIGLNIADRATGGKKEGAPSKARVWEVWDKEARKVLFISEGYPGAIEEYDDPLGLSGFFPTPEPLCITETNGDMTPIPEYCLYEDQARELDRITGRIAKLTEAIKAVGFYPGSKQADLAAAFGHGDNKLVPVEDWAGFVEKGGANMIAWLPVEQFGKVLTALFAKRDELLNTIYQLTGLSDIQRGATDPRETRGAQQLKAQFGTRRGLPKQQKLNKYLRDLYRLKAELIAENFSPETLQKMTGLEVSPQMVELMRDDHLRDFRIDIETDSTVAPDEAQDKQDAVEFLQGVGAFAQALASAGIGPQQAMPLLMPVVRRFKFGREVEDHLAALQKQPPPPNPEAERMKMEAQQKQAEFQMDMQKQKAELAFKREELALRERELQAKVAAQEAQAALKAREAEAKGALDMRIAEGEFLLKERESRQSEAMREREAQHKMRLEEARAEQKRQHDALKHAQDMEQRRKSAEADREARAKELDSRMAVYRAQADEEVEVRRQSEAERVRLEVEVNGRSQEQVAEKLDKVISELTKPKAPAKRKSITITRGEDGSLRATEDG